MIRDSDKHRPDRPDSHGSASIALAFLTMFRRLMADRCFDERRMPSLPATSDACLTDAIAEGWDELRSAASGSGAVSGGSIAAGGIELDEHGPRSFARETMQNGQYGVV